MNRKVKIFIIIIVAVLVMIPVSNTLFYAGTPFLNRTLIASLPYLPLTFAYQAQRTLAAWRYSTQVSVARATNTAPPPVPTNIPLPRELASRLPEDVVDALDVPIQRPDKPDKFGISTDARSSELAALGYAQTAKGLFVKTNTGATKTNIELTNDAKIVKKQQSINGKTVTVYSFE